MSKKIRVVMQQSMLVKYRIPFFRMLAARDGIDFTLLYGKFPGIPNVPADGLGFHAEYAPFHRLGAGRLAVFWQTAQLQTVRRGRADVAIMAWNTHYVSLLPALLRAKANGVPTILWGHGYSKREGALRRGMRNRLGRLGTTVIVYSHAAARRLCTEGWEPERVFVAQNALDQTPIASARAAWSHENGRLATFQRQNALAGADMLLYVSRFHPENRVDLLLHAVAKLRPEFPRIQAVLIGKVNAEAERMQALAKQLGIEHHVRFLGAIYEEEKIAPWFLSAKVFVYPANIGLSILHAFGYGLPVVTGDNIAQQNPEIDALVRGQNGELFADGDCTALANTLAGLLRDDERRASMGRNASETVQGEYNINTMVDGMEAAIRTCVAGG